MSGSGEKAPVTKAANAVTDAAASTVDKARAAASTSLEAAGVPVPKTLQTSDDAELAKWRKSFDANSQAADDGSRYLDEAGFVKTLVPKGDFGKIGPKQYALLFRVADSSRNGRISFDQLVAFESLLKRPDADYLVAWRIFDIDNDGTISFDEFRRVFSQNISSSSIPFDFDTPWIKLYLGKRSGQHVLGYNEFAQLMKGLQGERLRQSFRYFDKAETGYIQPSDFARIIRELAGHKLSDHVLERLPTLCTITAGGKISYSEVRAFNNVVHEMDAVETVIRHACTKSRDGRISQGDFATEAASTSRYGLFTPLEIATLWHFASPGKDGRLALRDFGALLDAKWQAPEFWEPEAKLPFLSELGRSVWNFGLGGIAGGLGATVVYPIDMVKTRVYTTTS